MKNLSSPSPTKSSGVFRISPSIDLQQRFCSPKRSREANENEQEVHNQASSKLQKPKKMTTKHFMSPTVSAASKAVVPRKKILAERNEASSGLISSDTQVHDSPDDLSFDCHSVRSSQTTPLSSRVSEPDCDLPDPLSQPYDPFTNYLSPRPKFLRYNPNRRIEILHRRGNELRKQGDEFGVDPIASLEPQKLVDEGTLSSQTSDSLSSSLGESSVKQGDCSPNADQLSPKPSSNGDNNECKDGSKENLEEVGEQKPLSEARDSLSSLLGDRSSPSDNKLGPRPSNNEEYSDCEDDNEEDEDENEKEEGHWHVKEVSKSLLLLLVLVISTSYISSMNSPSATPSQALWDLKEGYQKVQDHVSRTAMNDFMVSDVFLDLKQEKDQSLMETDVRVINEEMKNKEMVPGDVFHQLEEVLMLLEGINAEVPNSFPFSETQLELHYMDDMDMVTGKMSTETEAKSDQEENIEALATELNLEYYQVSDDAVQSEEPEVVSCDLNQVPSENITTQGIGKEEMDVHEVEEAEVIEDLGEEVTANSYQVRGETIQPGKLEVPILRVTNGWIKRKGRVGDELEKALDVTNGVEETFRVPPGREIGDAYESYESMKFPLNEFSFNKIDDQIIRFKNFSSEMEVLHTEYMRAHSISKLATLGISFLAVIAVSTALGFFLRLKHKKHFKKESSRTTQQSLRAKVVELKTPSLPKKVASIEKSEYYVNLSSSVHSEGKGSLDFNQSRTPTIELLGEYVVGQFSSSIKRHNLESKPVESEASSFSLSQEKKPRRKGISFANHEYSDFSAAQQSPSYGSFTAQEKIVIKEEGRDGEELMKVVTTPVRRSSRISSRAVMSP